MENTRIIYRNRDSSNYKTYHSPVLAGKMTKEQYKEILNCLEDREYFIPAQVSLDDTRDWGYDPEVDQPWWELVGYELTDQKPTVEYPTVEELVYLFQAAKGNWNEQEIF
ncbi:MAG: hypothetical protein DBX58_00540 [Clostridiales bacterium]|nr:MAG: hypothetical protein DBX58_00540 [Clostridiales bacterium]